MVYQSNSDLPLRQFLFPLSASEADPSRTFGRCGGYGHRDAKSTNAQRDGWPDPESSR